MHRNYYLFEKQVAHLAPQLTNSRIASVFTYRKNELVLHLQGAQDIYLKISVDVNYPYLFTTPFHQLRQPKAEFFAGLQGQTLHALHIQPADKLIRLEYDRHSLFAIFYGSHPNIYLLNEQKRVLDSFKGNSSELPPVMPPKENTFDFRHISQQKLHELLQHEPAQKMAYFLRRHFWAVNKTLLNELLFRLQADHEMSVAEIGAHADEKLLSVFHRLAEELEQEKTFIYYKEQMAFELSPFVLRHLQNKPSIEERVFEDVNTAWPRFIEEKPQAEAFLSLQARCRQALQKREYYLQNSLKKIQESEDILPRKQLAELKGNLLLTFKHRIPRGAKEVVLENIFEGSGEKIKIKLQEKLSAVENANRYFNKYKNTAERQELLQIKKQTFQAELEEIRGLLRQLPKMRSLRKLQNFYRQLLEMNLLQDKQIGNKKSAVNAYQFNRMILDGDWDIFIGKNGPNNEKLTFEFARKWDIWLHAQGVPGSHVIIRLPRRDFHPPQKIIELAAAIAAAQSKARHSATVPVIYTEVRHVHRIRKATPGTVSVRNEKVLFVKPFKLN